MSLDVSPYSGPSKLVSLLIALFLCCCWLPHSAQCLPTKRDAPDSMDRYQQLSIKRTVEARAVIMERALLATPNNSSVPGWNYLGCYTDSLALSLVLPAGTPRYILNGSSYTSNTAMTWAVCTSYCSSYQYAGISGGSTCRCGNFFTFALGLSLDASCLSPCSGSTSLSCGANDRSTIFVNSKYGIVASASPSASPQIVAPTTALLPLALPTTNLLPLALPTTNLLPLALPTTNLLPLTVPGVVTSPTLGAILPLVSSLAQSSAQTLQSVLLPSVSTSSILPLNGLPLLGAPTIVPSRTTQIVTLTPSPISPTITTAIGDPLAFLGPLLPQILGSVTTGLAQVAVPSLAPLAVPPVATVLSQILPGLQSVVPLNPLTLVAPTPTAAILSLVNLPPLAVPTLQPLANPLTIAPGILSPLTSVVSAALPGLLSTGAISQLPAIAPVPTPVVPALLSIPPALAASPLPPQLNPSVTTPGLQLPLPIAPLLPTNIGLQPGLLSLLPVVPLPQPTAGTVGAALPLGGLPLLGPLPSNPSNVLGSLNGAVTDALGGIAPLLPAVPLPSNLPAILPPLILPTLSEVPQLLTAVPLLSNLPAIQTPLPLALPTLPTLAVPQLDNILTAIPTLLSPILPTAVDQLALPTFPAVGTPIPTSQPGIPVPFDLFGNGVSGSVPVGSTSVDMSQAQVIDSGTVVDKVFTWTLYSDGSAQVDNTVLSPLTGPISGYLPDGTRVGMDSAGLYIGWDHRVPYPAEFLQIVKNLWLPPPQLFW